MNTSQNPRSELGQLLTVESTSKIVVERGFLRVFLCLSHRRREQGRSDARGEPLRWLRRVVVYYAAAGIILF
jgi:hypothetical protein